MQYGGTTFFSCTKAAHRVVSKGIDPSLLGRWCWTRYKGKNSHFLRIVTAYRINPPAGPYIVYAQQQQYFSLQNDTRCPRKVFLEDLCKELSQFSTKGDHIILLIDRNSSMKSSDLTIALQGVLLCEVLLDHYGFNGPEKCSKNTSRTPIDGIWTTAGILIKAGGYFAYDEVSPSTDHRCLWVDLSFTSAFGHTMPPIV